MALIRRARSADAATIAAVAVATYRETFGHLYEESDLSHFLNKSHSVASYRELLADPGCALWLIEGDGEAAGYCVAGPCSLPVPDMPAAAGEVSRLYLRERYKGEGLGAKMLDIALDWLAARYDPIYLSVYAENPRAQALYRSRGFVKILDYFYMVGEQADPEWVMELRR